MKIVLQALVILFNYLGAYSTEKKNIFIFFVISTIFSILMFYYVGQYAAILPVATTGIRYFIYIFKNKYKTKFPLYFCLTMHIIAFIISTNSIKTIVDIIPSVLVIIGCIVYWYLDGEKLKKYVVLLNIPWIIYYICCGLYLTTVNLVIQNILMFIAIIRLRKKTIVAKKCYN